MFSGGNGVAFDEIGINAKGSSNASTYRLWKNTTERDSVAVVASLLSRRSLI